MSCEKGKIDLAAIASSPERIQRKSDPNLAKIADEQFANIRFRLAELTKQGIKPRVHVG